MLVSGPRRCDMRLLFDILSAKHLEELSKRGYDLTTLKFSIKRKIQNDDNGIESK